MMIFSSPESFDPPGHRWNMQAAGGRVRLKFSERVSSTVELRGMPVRPGDEARIKRSAQAGSQRATHEDGCSHHRAWHHARNAQPRGTFAHAGAFLEPVQNSIRI
jgi:hypothetical protein